MHRRIRGEWAGAVGLAFAFGLLGCAPPIEAAAYPKSLPKEGDAIATESPTGVARFLDREIDLAPFLEGFPHHDFEAELEHGRLSFVTHAQRYQLRSFSVPASQTPADRGAWSLDRATEVGEVDWSGRSLWSTKRHASTATLWLHADDHNDEKMNLWVMPEDGSAAPVQVTHADYVYGFGMSPDEGKIAYLARRGTQAPYETCLRVLTPTTASEIQAAEDREIVCDSPGLRFTWGAPRFSADAKTVYFNAQTDGDRRQVQIVSVTLPSSEVRTVTDPKASRSSASILDRFVGGELIYVANDDGFRNLYAHDPKRGRSRQITRFQEDIGGAAMVDAGIFVSHGTPAGTTIELVDPKDGRSLLRGGVPGQVTVLDGHGNRVLWTHQSPDVVFELNETRIDGEVGQGEGMRFDNVRRVELPAELAAQVVACKATAVQIPTFDGQSLHAFLLEPSNPLPADRRLALVRSFYGGEATYTRYDHVMCAAGITVLSPAVRGSSGFGKDFAAQNDGDLGGDEIVDLFFAARWLEEKTGLPPKRIGVYGRSHGGYATMRALTFPPETNDRDESYPFGFGLAEAGFSDILAFHGATNIPDWVVLEAGDPAVPEDRRRIVDRSPLTHVGRLRSPIFLLHGENDWRVPVEGSRAFAAKAESLGKAVTYLEFPGQGHHVEGLENVAKAFQARFDFLSGLFDPKPATDSEP